MSRCLCQHISVPSKCRHIGCFHGDLYAFCNIWLAEFIFWQVIIKMICNFSDNRRDLSSVFVKYTVFREFLFMHARCHFGYRRFTEIHAVGF